VSKKQDIRLLPITLPYLDRLSKLFHHRTQQQTCNEMVVKETNTPHTHRYTTLGNINDRKLAII